MEPAEDAEGKRSYRPSRPEDGATLGGGHGHAGDGLGGLAELDLAARLRPLIQFIARLVARSPWIRQAADLDDVVQDVLHRLTPKMRGRAVIELLRLSHGAVRWCLATHVGRQHLLPATVDPASLRVLPAPAQTEAEVLQFLPSFITFASGLRPLQRRICMAIFSGCTGVAEIARVAGVRERRVGVLLSEVVFHAMEFFPLLGHSRR